MEYFILIPVNDNWSLQAVAENKPLERMLIFGKCVYVYRVCQLRYFRLMA